MALRKRVGPALAKASNWRLHGIEVSPRPRGLGDPYTIPTVGTQDTLDGLTGQNI
jgi:hypothetical protein